MNRGQAGCKPAWSTKEITYSQDSSHSRLKGYSMGNAKSLMPLELVERAILVIKGQKVIIDADLARLYDVTTKRLNQQVSRNPDRFPADFMFQLNSDEKAEVVANCDHLSKLKFSPVLPYDFTEYGAIMAASVLNTPRAIEASVFVVRVLVKLREMISNHAEMPRQLSELDYRLQGHDEKFDQVFAAIRQLMAPPDPPRKRIGFEVDEPKARYGKKGKKLTVISLRKPFLRQPGGRPHPFRPDPVFFSKGSDGEHYVS